MLFNPVQLKNRLKPVEVTEPGMVMLARLLHPAKAIPPIVVTELPMLTLERLVQLPNVRSPMEVTELEMEMLVNPDK